MTKNRLFAIAVSACVLAAPVAARAQIQKSGPEVFPGRNEFSLHLGGQIGFVNYTAIFGDQLRFAGGTPSGGRIAAEYGRQLTVHDQWSVWLNAGLSSVFNVCNVDFAGVHYNCSGSEIRPFAGVKFKFKTPIPLIPYAKADVGFAGIVGRYCGDNGMAPVLQLAGGAKYFLTKALGVGLEAGFSFGPAFFAGATGLECFQNGYGYDSHVEFYGAFDISAGAEFIF